MRVARLCVDCCNAASHVGKNEPEILNRWRGGPSDRALARLITWRPDSIGRTEARSRVHSRYSALTARSENGMIIRRCSFENTEFAVLDVFQLKGARWQYS